MVRIVLGAIVGARPPGVKILGNDAPQKSAIGVRDSPAELRVLVPNFVSGLFNRFWINWASKAKQGQSRNHDHRFHCNGQNRGAAAVSRGPPVVSIILESIVMVLNCPCLALEAQLIQNLLNKPLTEFGRCWSIVCVFVCVGYSSIAIFIPPAYQLALKGVSLYLFLSSYPEWSPCHKSYWVVPSRSWCNS